MFSLTGYKPLDVIHQGPRRAVLRALSLKDQRSVIVKMLVGEYPSQRELARLRHECELVQRAAGEDAAQVCELREEGNGLALILEDIGGAAMSKLLAERRMDLDRFFDIALQLTRALGKIHQRQIIHKDINPSNIVLNLQTGELRIIDFGIASLLSREDPQVGSPGMIEGTLAYISPEQTGRMNRAIDWRTDFYSLGATFYQMLTGRLPFETPDAMELVHCHIARTPPAPHDVDATVPPMLSCIVLKLLAKTAEERYGSASGLAADLEECRRQWRAHRKIELFVPGKHDINDRFQIPQKLYGRETEVAALMSAFDRVSDGATELMLVCGYAGIGKSALVNEIHKPVVAKRGYFVSGKCDQLQRNVPFASVLMAMNELVRQLLTESDEQLAAWRDRLRRALGPNGQVVADVIPDLQLVIGPQPPVPDLPPGPSQNRFNLVFQQFIGVFTSAEHPLVIFLDDLQWSDSASLALLEVLLADLETRWLLLIGAYRDSEVGPDHPLRVTLDKLAARATPFSEVALTPLDLPTVTDLVCDTLHSDGARGGELAELVLQKTAGTPFFVSEFLKTLHEDGHLRFEPGSGRWTWELERLRSLQMTDNVVDLMAQKLRKLPARTRAVVELAACIGAEFDVDMLSLVAGQSRALIMPSLWELLLAGFILPVGSEYRLAFAASAGNGDEATGASSEKARFRFLHDRVQQAAYSLIEPEQRPHTHLRIGRLLMAASERSAISDLSFDVVDHLNRGRDLIDARGEQDRLLWLNLAATCKAKAATAFGPALAYATAGISLIDEDRWRRDPGSCFRLHIEAAECAYLVGDYERMEELCRVALTRARSPLEQAEVHEVRIKACMARNELTEAVQTARQALLPLGVRLPRKASKAHVLPGLAHAMWLIGRRHTAELALLPEMTDPVQLVVMRILTTVAQPAYYAAPDLLPVILLRMVVISLRYGNTPLAPYAWMSYAHIINLVFGKARVALRYGEFSRQLLEHYGATEYRAKIEFMFHTFVRHWTTHWRETLAPLLSAYQYGLQTGDLEYGATAIHLYCYHLFSVAKELAFVEAEMARYNAAIVAMKQVRSENNARLRYQVVLNLIGGSAQPWRLVGEQFDEDQALPEMDRVQDQTALSQFHLYRAQLSYLFGQSAEAVEHIERAGAYVEGLNGLILMAIYRQYQALILLEAAAKPETAPRLRRRYQRRAAAARRDLAKWAAMAPMNHTHRVELIDAERAALHGRDLEAIALYDRAIASARENEYIADEALALERAAYFHLARGRVRIARGYARDARHTWLRWGAGAKVAQLDALYPELLFGGDGRNTVATSALHVTESTTAVTLDDAGRSAGDRLELSTVMKASHAIAGEIILPRLLERLMRLAIENAGAEKGFLIFETDGRLCIEAEGALDSDIVPVLRSVPIDTAPGEEARLPASIVKYVARTLEAVVLNDASLPGRFSRDPYVVAHRPRSVLCAPLLDQGKLSAVIYLENNLTTAAFTPSRLEMLRMLSAQAAISIDNARLYAEQLQLTEAQSRFVPGEFLHSLNRETIVDVALGDNVRKEMTVLFSDIRGFTTLVENMSPAEHIGFINSYLSYMEPAIRDNGGFVDSYIGDAIMALFDGSADRAVQAGIDMGRNLDRLNDERAQRGQAPIQIGVGVNTGILTLGTIGGPTHIKCGVIGDSVNLAARVESLTKTYGAALLISHHTRERLADPGRYPMRQIARVQVMGKSVPVTLYEILDAETAPRRAAKLATLAAFERGVAAYYRADFAAARQQFATCVERYEHDVAARAYLARCEQYAATDRRDGWDGVEVLDHK
ncbi:MAG: AAA family ATPase [Deltaproteobacteria bacterium]|nr:AAA family ATPase [Deltaproteobacteria bacterium]